MRKQLKVDHLESVIENNWPEHFGQKFPAPLGNGSEFGLDAALISDIALFSLRPDRDAG